MKENDFRSGYVLSNIVWFDLSLVVWGQFWSWEIQSSNFTEIVQYFSSKEPVV